MTERVNRAIIAGVGACAMIVVGVLNQDSAIAGVDFNTIMLLAGMMLIVGITRRTVVFEYLAIWSVKVARAQPAGILLGLSVATAVLSALLDNVTTVLLVVPVTIAIAKRLKVPAYPLLVGEVMASNIGGTATLVGDPPNIMIGSAADLSFNAFVLNLTPVVVVILAANALALHLLWGRRLRAAPEDRERVLAMNEREAITDPVLLKHCLWVLAAVLVTFVLARVVRLEPGTIAMAGAPRSTQDQTHRVHASFGDVEWITLFFFIGLFIIVAGVERAGGIDRVARWMLGVTGGNLMLAATAILWGSAILSAIVDNIPLVATMIPLLKEVGPELCGGEQNVNILWWALALGACLGGNGTLIGASANLTVAGLAERQGVAFRFLAYTKVAFPLMLMSIVLAQVYLFVRYL
ncbi:MAG: ArsB/NhaD family transporter [Gemmatimonadetes bacterium]|nr:ArsB/NhaD family transporter [Gemmatimonadota bacterium]